MRTLSYQEARRVYDRIGSAQDSQAFYEDQATDDLIGHGDFGTAQSVFELGCGTGRFAAKLLEHELPPGASYRGVDLSPTMVALAEKRLSPFPGRARVDLSDGKPPTSEPAGAYDRWVSNYVLDLLSDDDIRAALAEAHRMLRAGGLLCLASLSTGAGPGSRAVARVWSWVHRLQPKIVGGCRPLALASYLPEDQWRLRHHAKPAPFCVPSEVVVAERR